MKNLYAVPSHFQYTRLLLTERLASDVRTPQIRLLALTFVPTECFIGGMARDVQRSDDARVEYLIVCPLTNSSLEECEKYRHSKTTRPDLCRTQKDYSTKTLPQVTIKKSKKLCESGTTLRNNRKGHERYKTYVQVHRVMHGTLGKTKERKCV